MQRRSNSADHFCKASGSNERLELFIWNFTTLKIFLLQCEILKLKRFDFECEALNTLKFKYSLVFLSFSVQFFSLLFKADVFYEKIHASDEKAHCFGISEPFPCKNTSKLYKRRLGLAYSIYVVQFGPVNWIHF